MIVHQAVAENPSAHMNMAHALLPLGKEADIRKAIDEYQAAKEVDEEHKYVRLYMARC